MSNPDIRRVGVVVKTTSPEAAELGQQLIAELKRLGIDPVVDTESCTAFDCEGSVDRAGLASQVDLIVVLGGDGTLLSVTRDEIGDTPVLGINMGSLGFLTEHSADSLFPMLAMALEGRATLEQRERLQVTVSSPDREPVSAWVLNDAVINKGALARMIVLSVHVDGTFVSHFRADGLIVSSPTGSTAYNLSAGGPILYPTLDAMVVTPICPHALTNRPIVLALDSVVEIRLEGSAEKVYLTLDGQQGFPISDRDLVRIERCPQPIQLITEPSQSYFQVLHHKLKWGERRG